MLPATSDGLLRKRQKSYYQPGLRRWHQPGPAAAI